MGLSGPKSVTPLPNCVTRPSPGIWALGGLGSFGDPAWSSLIPPLPDCVAVHKSPSTFTETSFRRWRSLWAMKKSWGEDQQCSIRSTWIPSFFAGTSKSPLFFAAVRGRREPSATRNPLKNLVISGGGGLQPFADLKKYQSLTGGGIRTRAGITQGDFKSPASTNSATPACPNRRGWAFGLSARPCQSRKACFPFSQGSPFAQAAHWPC